MLDAAISFRITRFDSIPSTNDYLLERIRKGAATAGEVCVAREQPGARGRMGRRWVAEAGGLWFTVALPLHPPAVGWGGMLAALAVCEALDDLGLRAGVKWPNDVVIAGKKLAGVLVEAVAGQPLAAVGVGLNVSNRVGAVVRGQWSVVSGGRPQRSARPTAASSSAWPATSVALEVGREIEPGPLLTPILEQMGDRWAEWEAGRMETLQAAWAGRDASRGERVRLVPDGPEGVAEGIDALGRLQVRLASRDVVAALAGELIFLAPGR